MRKPSSNSIEKIDLALHLHASAWSCHVYNTCTAKIFCWTIRHAVFHPCNPASAITCDNHLLLDDSILSHFERCHSKNNTNIIDIRLWPLIYCNYNNLLCISNNSECMILLVSVYIKLAIMIIPLKLAKLLLH